MIVFEVEQDELLSLARPPRFELLPVQFEDALPAVGLAVDRYNVGLRHGTLTRRPPRR
jgi:hypothetical protein